jgi:hypothetical protein
VAARETLDHYRDAEKLVDQNLDEVFRGIEAKRREFIHRLEDAVRALGDLPAVPDPDKESGEMLLHHVAALFQNDYSGDIINQRIESEKKLADLVKETHTDGLDASHQNLLQEFDVHIAETIKQLRSVNRIKE